MRIIAAGIVLATVLTGAHAATAQAKDASCWYYTGMVGPHRIGAAMAIDNVDHLTITAANYYYVGKDVDIPLQAATRDGVVTLREPGGGIFTLRFKGDPAKARPPYTFYNTNDLTGEWRRGETMLRASISLASSGACPGEPKYADLGVTDDAAFEAMVARFIRGVTSGNVAETARSVHFPLRINRGTASFAVRDAAGLKAQWRRIFPPAYVAKVRQAVPHDLFVRNAQAMIGSGEAWFDGDGAVAINPVS